MDQRVIKGIHHPHNSWRDSKARRVSLVILGFLGWTDYLENQVTLAVQVILVLTVVLARLESQGNQVVRPLGCPDVPGVEASWDGLVTLDLQACQEDPACPD
jgi:hypothetical protein